MRFFTTVGLEEGEGEVGLVMDQYVARPFHSQREEWVVFWRGVRMEVGGR